MRGLVWMSIPLALVGCGAANDSADYMDEDLPAGHCEDTEGEVCETGGQGDQCQSTQDCDAGLVCGAAFDGDIGAFECQSACVPTMDETRWCIDDASCCDAAASCGLRGYCVMAGATGATESSGTSDDGASTSTGGQ